MVRTGFQLTTLRGIDESLLRKLDRVAATTFDGVEFAGLEGIPPDRIAERLDTLGLCAIGAHVEVDDIEEATDEVIETYAHLGCDRLVVRTADGVGVATDDAVDRTAGRLSALGGRVAAADMGLLYHTGSAEFASPAAFDRFVDALDPAVGLEIDTGQAQHAGADPVALLRRYAGRTPLVHLTDSRSNSDRTPHVELGGGEVDLAACIATARATGVEWLIYEHGRTADPIASLDHSDAALSALIGA
ncbi:sugar phosphate isomerase/epimerase family protein [Halomarina oriensis]|nr:sugar phosphate isomerase/epimerase [Halomarina oriensis]